MRISTRVYTGNDKKAVEIAHLAANMPGKGGQIEVILSRWGIRMGGTRNKPAKGKTSSDGNKKPPPRKIEDDEEEDGDIATPKRDRTGEDDQPL